MNAYAFAGTFVTAGTSPDGDTIRFRPDRPRHLDALAGSERLVWSKQGTVQVRLEGIDAPELHYEGQRQRRGAFARTRLLRRLGFSRVELFGDWVLPHRGDRESSSRGWIVAASADVRGRVIAFTYRATDLAIDHAVHEGPVALDGAIVRASANADMLACGAAYGLFYASLAPYVRTTLRSIALAARNARRGVWSHDTTRAFALSSLGSIGTRGALVMPKLFRRCVTFCREGVTTSARAFVEWLRAGRAQDDIVSTDHRRVRLSALLSARDDRVRVAADPLWMVFDPEGG